MKLHSNTLEPHLTDFRLTGSVEQTVVKKKKKLNK